MRRVLALAVAATLLAAAPALGATRSVRVGDDWFVRDGRAPTVTVKRGDRVRWRWVGRDDHNVSVRSGPAKFRSSTMDSGSFTRKVSKRGTYRIICTIHQPSMRMTLRVR